MAGNVLKCEASGLSYIVDRSSCRCSKQDTDKDKNNPPPLLILLHGSGADENDLIGLGPLLAPSCGGAVVVSLRALLGNRQQGYLWFSGSSTRPSPAALSNQIGDARDAVVTFIQAAPTQLGTDPSSVFVVGFSQGATITWTVAASKWPRQDLVKGAACLSGRLMPELASPSTPLGSTAAGSGEQQKRPAVFACHGTKDCVTPFGVAKSTLAVAKGLKIPHVFVQFDGGHTIDTPDALPQLIGHWQ